jgi:hypothetical protein
MKNLWPDKFDESDKPSAKSLLEEQARLLSKITDNIVFAEVSEYEGHETILGLLKNDFAFRFDIKGKFLPDYSFNVLKFSHDITLYPVRFLLDEKVRAELGVSRGVTMDIENPADLEELLERVLKTERIKSVVGALIRLSR